MNKFGPDLLLAQCLEHIEGEYDWMWKTQISESTIEHLFFLAVYWQIRLCNSEYRDLVVAVDDADAQHKLNNHYDVTDLIMQPQAKIEDWRVDFLFYVREWPQLTKYRKIIVECDGHDFHERTKEQAERDRSRDRHAIANGLQVMRFTGSELWRDPWGCASEFLTFAAKDWGLTEGGNA